MKHSGLADSPLFDKPNGSKKYPEIQDEVLDSDIIFKGKEKEIIQPSIETANESADQSIKNEIKPESKILNATVFSALDQLRQFMECRIRRL